MAWAYFLCHQPFPSLSLLTVLGKPREHFPSSSLKPAIKASQSPYTLSRSHPLACGFGNGFATLWGLGACAHAAMVLTPAVGQSFGLTGVASGSGIGFAFDSSPHGKYVVSCSGFFEYQPKLIGWRLCEANDFLLIVQPVFLPRPNRYGFTSSNSFDRRWIKK